MIYEICIALFTFFCVCKTFYRPIRTLNERITKECKEIISDIFSTEHDLFYVIIFPFKQSSLMKCRGENWKETQLRLRYACLSFW